jgi:hypothetical protein
MSRLFTLKFVISILLVIGITACSDKETNTESSSDNIIITGVAALRYNSDQTNLTGSITVSATQLVQGAHNVSLSNVMINPIEGCELEESLRALKVLSFNTNGSQLLNIDLTFPEKCDARTLSISYNRSVRTTDTTGNILSADLVGRTLAFLEPVQIALTGSNDTTPINTEVQSNSNANLSMFFEPSFIDIYAPGQEIPLQITIIDENYVGHEANITLSKIFDASTGVDSIDQANFGAFKEEKLNAAYYASKHFGEATATYVAPKVLPTNTQRTATVIAYISETQYVEKNITIRYQSAAEFQKQEYAIYPSIPDSFHVGERAYFGFKIAAINDETNIISDAKVKSLSINIETDYLAEFIDINDIPLGSGSINAQSTAVKTVTISANTKSGFGLVKVTALLDTSEGDVTLSKTFDFVVQSGPVSAISIVYDTNGTAYENGLYSNNYTIHAVDKYGNPANDGEHVYVSVINGLELQNGTVSGDIFDIAKVTKKHFYPSNGTINSSTNGGSILSVSDVPTSNIDFTTDRLIILSNRFRNDQDYTGFWTLDSTDGNSTQSTINLVEKYSGTQTNNLTFVIGDETRYNPCNLTNNVADLDSRDGTYQVKDGVAKFKLRYDPFLVGKDVYIAANSFNGTKRVGNAIREKLLGYGIESTEIIVTGPDDDDNPNTTLFTNGYAEPGLFQVNNELLLVQNTATTIRIKEGSCRFIEKISELASFKEYSDFANTSEIFGSVLTGTKPTSINNQKITSCENGRISMYLLVPEGKSCTVVADKYVDYEEK